MMVILSANFNARHVGLDRFELAANLAGSVGLDVEHVLMGRSARQEDVDDRLVRLAQPGCRFALQQSRQGDAAHRHPAYREEIAAGQTIAKPRTTLRRPTQDGQHVEAPSYGSV
jgi:hypothetical protein